MKKSKSRNTRIAKKKFARKVSSKQKKSLVQKTSQNVVQFPTKHAEIQKINHALAVGAKNKKNPQHKEEFLEFAAETIHKLLDACSEVTLQKVIIPPHAYDYMTESADLLLNVMKEIYLSPDADEFSPLEELTGQCLVINAEKIGSTLVASITEFIPPESLALAKNHLGIHLLSALLDVHYELDFIPVTAGVIDPETGNLTDREGNPIESGMMGFNPRTNQFISIN